jgi:hypothetical protein
VPLAACGPDYVPPPDRLAVFDNDGEGHEFAYTAGVEASLERAHADSWTIVSCKDDCATVFADQPPHPR